MRTMTDTSLVIIIHNSNWKNKSHNYSRHKTPKHHLLIHLILASKSLFFFHIFLKYYISRLILDYLPHENEDLQNPLKLLNPNFTSFLLKKTKKKTIKPNEIGSILKFIIV